LTGACKKIKNQSAKNKNEMKKVMVSLNANFTHCPMWDEIVVFAEDI